MTEPFLIKQIIRNQILLFNKPYKHQTSYQTNHLSVQMVCIVFCCCRIIGKIDSCCWIKCPCVPVKQIVIELLCKCFNRECVADVGKTNTFTLKLEKAVRVFGADLNDRVILDAGASTGGFTDVCLRNGARHVYAVDVGYGQLDWKLRNHPRVTVMERTNARFLTADMFPEKPEIAVMDVSFISIRLILPALIGILGDHGIIYSLIKPQFEAGRDKVGKKGVVRDPITHEEVIRTITSFVQSVGWTVCRLDYSPITGPEGNIEFLSEIRKAEDSFTGITDNDIRSVVAEAHRKLTNEQGDGHL